LLWSVDLSYGPSAQVVTYRPPVDMLLAELLNNIGPFNFVRGNKT